MGGRQQLLVPQTSLPTGKINEAWYYFRRWNGLTPLPVSMTPGRLCNCRAGSIARRPGNTPARSRPWLFLFGAAFCSSAFAPLRRQTNEDPTRRLWPAAVFVLLLATLLRFHLLGAQSPLERQGNSARLSERSIPAIVQGTASDVHPPLLYLALRGWRELLGRDRIRPAPCRPTRGC